MSKKHGAKRKHRKKAAKRPVMCASCGQPADEPWGLLASLAATLNACEDAGLKVVLTGWQSVITRKGYVLRLTDRRWAPRTADYEPFPLTAGDDALDDMDT